jgi:large conductance mechanosensitive channel
MGLGAGERVSLSREDEILQSNSRHGGGFHVSGDINAQGIQRIRHARQRRRHGVKSLVADIMMPIVGLITGGVDFANVFVTLKGESFPTLKAAQEAGAVTLNLGLFINAVISFVIVAFALFLLIKGMNKMKRQQEEAPEEAPPPPRDIQLLEEIRDALVKR